jgi:hypothetical protein
MINSIGGAFLCMCQSEKARRYCTPYIMHAVPQAQKWQRGTVGIVMCESTVHYARRQYRECDSGRILPTVLTELLGSLSISFYERKDPGGSKEMILIANISRPTNDVTRNHHKLDGKDCSAFSLWEQSILSLVLAFC